MSMFVSPALPLSPLRDMLRFYCQALTGQKIDLRELKQLVDKNIGWSKTDVATTDGVAIYLPSIIDRFETAKDNFNFLKVMVTQQAGHIEFGSFSFRFDRRATRFDDLRLKVPERLAYHDHDHGHEGASDVPTRAALMRFFRLFPHRRLASDIFAILEAGRVEARLMREYPGIAKTYEEMRKRALEIRPEMTLLPAREALLEFLIRVSLGQRRLLRIPKMSVDAAQEIDAIMNLLVGGNTTVEDSAEGTLRLYRRLARIANELCEPNAFTVFRRRSSESSISWIPAYGHSWTDEESVDSVLPLLAGRERGYVSPSGVDYRGEFQPELAQLLLPREANSREERRSLTAEELGELLHTQRMPKRRDAEVDDGQDDPQTAQMVQNLLREIDRRDPRMQSVSRRPSGHAEEEGGALAANQLDTFVYDEWNVFEKKYRSSWCKLYERIMLPGDVGFYKDTLLMRRSLLARVRNEFEQVVPDLYRKEKRLADGVEHDLDGAIESLTDLRVGVTPSEKIFWRQRKSDRDVAVAFLLDMSGSTGEAIARTAGSSGAAQENEPAQKRIIDIEKEAIVLMSDALESIGDRYGVYGFSGHGRDNVEFYVIKDLAEPFSLEIAKRFSGIGPLHATRMGPAIRHTTAKLRQEQARAKFLLLLSDGRPQDRGYSQESSEKEYAVQDTRMALIEARSVGIHPFCLTVDKDGNDYLRKMMGDFSYEVLADVSLLPLRLPQLYRKLTM